jgi:hypothetical protein
MSDFPLTLPNLGLTVVLYALTLWAAFEVGLAVARRKDLQRSGWLADQIVQAYRDGRAEGVVVGKMFGFREGQRSRETWRGQTMKHLYTEAEWTEEDGPVLWWKFPVTEPPWVGTPLCCGRTMRVRICCGLDSNEIELTHDEPGDGWPGYHTHWQRIKVPKEPRIKVPKEPK